MCVYLYLYHLYLYLFVKTLKITIKISSFLHFYFGQCDSVGWASSCQVKGQRLDSHQDKYPGYRFNLQSGNYEKAANCYFILSPHPSFSLSKSNKKTVLSEDLKKVHFTVCKFYLKALNNFEIS